MAFKIEYVPEALNDLKLLSAFARRRVLENLDVQLRHEPNQQTRNRKLIAGLTAEWARGRPIWQLRIDRHRVFYDVDVEHRVIWVLAVRFKPPHKQTEDIV